MCPHRMAFVLAEGLVGENENGPYISCPLHKRNYQLDAKREGAAGSCSDPDYSIMTFEAKEEDDKVLLLLPPTDALDAVLSTSKWMICKAEEESNTIVQSSGVSIAGPTSADEREAKEDKLRSAGVDVARARDDKAGKGVGGAGWGDSALEW